MKKILAALVGFVLILGCGEAGKGDKDNNNKKQSCAAGPQNAAPDKQNPVPNPGDQVPAPAADPGPQNDPHAVQIVLWWRNSCGGHVTVRKNNIIIHDSQLPGPQKDSRGVYNGVWKFPILGLEKRNVIDFYWRPDNNATWYICAIYHNARIADSDQGSTGTCSLEAEIL